MIIGAKSYDGLEGIPPGDFWESFPVVKRKKVFIKPNLVTPLTKWDSASTTDVRVVRSVIEKLQKEGCEDVIVGDCGFKGQWENTIRSTGYWSLPRSYGVKLIPLQDGPNFHKFTLQRCTHKYLSLFGARFSDYMLECDMVIDVPKMKVHKMAVMTGAIKNMMGTMIQKGSMHPRGDANILHKRLCDLYFLIKDKIKFIVVDGIVGSEYAEQGGVPVHSDILVSGVDPWEVDVSLAKLMRIEPSNVRYLDYIRRELGRSFDEISVPKGFVKEYELPLGWR
jgi:uncharacterized protein (DUF362 family)